MKFMGMPVGMWVLFGKSFERNLTAVFGLSPKEARLVMARQKENTKKSLKIFRSLKKVTAFG